MLGLHEVLKRNLSKREFGIHRDNDKLHDFPNQGFEVVNNELGEEFNNRSLPRKSSAAKGTRASIAERRHTTAFSERTMKRKDAQAEMHGLVTAEVASWARKLLSLDTESDPEGTTFLDQCRTGNLLCKLATKVMGKRPRGKRHSELMTQKNKYFARENVMAFLTAIKKAGVSETVLFSPDELVDGKDEVKVMKALLAFSLVAFKRYNVEPPELIRMQVEIDQLEEVEEVEEIEEEEIGPSAAVLEAAEAAAARAKAIEEEEAAWRAEEAAREAEEARRQMEEMIRRKEEEDERRRLQLLREEEERRRRFEEEEMRRRKEEEEERRREEEERRRLQLLREEEARRGRQEEEKRLALEELRRREEAERRRLEELRRREEAERREREEMRRLREKEEMRRARAAEELRQKLLIEEAERLAAFKRAEEARERARRKAIEAREQAVAEAQQRRRKYRAKMNDTLDRQVAAQINAATNYVEKTKGEK
eukprot:g2204.t1